MTVHTIHDRPWDSFDAYLFDIDGTLINCTDAVHYFAFLDSLKTVSGRPLTLEGVTAHGNTDGGILRDVFTLAGIPDTDWRPRLPEIRAAMGRFVAAREAEIYTTVLPHVPEVLEHLRQRGATLGVATGNLREIGEAKLRRAGLLDFFTVGGWSDGFEQRPDMIRNAIGLVTRGASICIVGDTPADIVAAHANQLPVIAVATGIYTREQLREHKPELCVGSLRDLLS